MDFFKHSFMELAGWRDIEKYLSDGISPVCATGLSHIHKAAASLYAQRKDRFFSCYRQRGGSKTSMR